MDRLADESGLHRTSIGLIERDRLDVHGRTSRAFSWPEKGAAGVQPTETSVPQQFVWEHGHGPDGTVLSEVLPRDITSEIRAYRRVT